MSNSSDNPFKQLFQAVDPDGQVSEEEQQQLLNVLEAMMGKGWGDVTQQMGLLMADLDPETVPQATANSDGQKCLILPRLAQTIESATALVAQIPTKPGDESALNVLRQLDFYLAEAALSISDLQHSRQNTPPDVALPAASKPAALPSSSPKPRRLWQMPWQVLMVPALILLPFGIKFGLPRLMPAPAATTPQSASLYQVTGIEGQTIQLRRADGTTSNLRLLGLANAADPWQTEANGVIAMLVKSSGGQVRLESVVPQSSRDQVRAIARLPNGTSLQEILLAGGLARINDQEISLLPENLATTLQQAQATAQAQHKNIWGDVP